MIHATLLSSPREHQLPQWSSVHYGLQCNIYSTEARGAVPAASSADKSATDKRFLVRNGGKKLPWTKAGTEAHVRAMASSISGVHEKTSRKTDNSRARVNASCSCSCSDSMPISTPYCSTMLKHTRLSCSSALSEQSTTPTNFNSAWSMGWLNATKLGTRPSYTGAMMTLSDSGVDHESGTLSLLCKFGDKPPSPDIRANRIWSRRSVAIYESRGGEVQPTNSPTIFKSTSREVPFALSLTAPYASTIIACARWKSY